MKSKIGSSIVNLKIINSLGIEVYNAPYKGRTSIELNDAKGMYSILWLDKDNNVVMDKKQIIIK